MAHLNSNSHLFTLPISTFNLQLVTCDMVMPLAQPVTIALIP